MGWTKRESTVIGALALIVVVVAVFAAVALFADGDTAVAGGTGTVTPVQGAVEYAPIPVVEGSTPAGACGSAAGSCADGGEGTCPMTGQGVPTGGTQTGGACGGQGGCGCS